MPCTQGANSPGVPCKARDANFALCCPTRGRSGSGLGPTLCEGPAGTCQVPDAGEDLTLRRRPEHGLQFGEGKPLPLSIFSQALGQLRMHIPYWASEDI